MVKADSAREKAEHILIQDVHDAVADLVELIKTYKSKNRLAQVVVSSLFKRRQEEADAVISCAMSRLQVRLPTTICNYDGRGRCASCMRENITLVGNATHGRTQAADAFVVKRST